MFDDSLLTDPMSLSLSARNPSRSEIKKSKNRSFVNELLESDPILVDETFRKAPVAKSITSSAFMTNAGIFDDEFNRLVRQGLGKSSLLTIRKDRRGIAIQKGSKRHRITFRDELDMQ